MTKQRLNIDASALSQSSCDYRLKLTVIDGLKQGVVNNDTLYGTAFHKFTSTMHETNGEFMTAVAAAKAAFSKPCIIKPEKKHLTENHLIKTCLDYWEHFGQKDDFEILHDENGKPLVEVTFEILVYESADLEIYLCGTIDKIGKFKNGAYAIGDYKVTSSWKVDAYLRPYRLSTQLHTYHWALTELAKRNPDSALGKIGQYPVGVFIDGIFAKTNKDTEFHRSEVFFFKKDEYIEFDRELIDEAEKLAYIWTTKTGRRNGLINGSCHNGYGPCKFFNICSMPDEISRQHIIKNQFVSKPYEPLKFGDD